MTVHTRRASGASLLCAVLLLSSTAAAQTRSVLVLPVSIGEADTAVLGERTEAVVGAFTSGELAPVAVDDALARFHEHGSEEPPSVSETEIDEWARLSREAVRRLASADYPGAREMLLEAQALSDRAAAEMNREATRARQVLDTCLYEVRALVETQDPRARTRAMECRRLVPRIAPSPYNHTPEVVELLGRVDRELAAAPPGSLRLESDPVGCSVRLNGIALGETPFVSEDLATGEYRAQVECEDGVRGRVHRIRLGEGTITVRIDARFDDAVRSDAVLRLAYADADAADTHRLADAISVAATVGAAEVWLLTLEEGDVVRLDRVLVGSHAVLASMRTPTRTGLGTSIRSLAQGHSEDRTGETVIAMARWGGADAASPADESDPSEASLGRADWELGLGVALGALAIGGYVGAFYFALDGQRLGLATSVHEPTSAGYLPALQTWQDSRSLGWTFASLGGALAVAAVALAASEERDVPWWSWLLGGVGLAGAVTGIVLAGTGNECGRQRPELGCISGTTQRDTGIVVASLSAPLLAVPVVHLLRAAVRGPVAVTPSISASASGATLEALGTF